MSDPDNLPCQCHDPRCDLDAFHETDLGADHTKSRFGNVSLFDCRFCGRRWLYYSIGYEFWSQPRRWYRGLITVQKSRSITPENAVEVLSGLSWYLCSGSEDESVARQGSGSIAIELDAMTGSLPTIS